MGRYVRTSHKRRYVRKMERVTYRRPGWPDARIEEAQARGRARVYAISTKGTHYMRTYYYGPKGRGTLLKTVKVPYKEGRRME